jgi:hypothetical protein
MTSSRTRKRIYYGRLSALPLDLMAITDELAQSARRLEDHLGFPRRRGSLHYILKGRTPVAAPFWKQTRWMTEKNHGAQRATLTIARSKAGRYTVSTIFLGLDHGSYNTGGPVLFETMAYARRPDGSTEWRDEQYRYRTWADAIKGHRQFTARLAVLRAVPS